MLHLRFYLDPDTGLPHFYQHGVKEYEVADIIERPGEDRAGRDGSRVAIGQTRNGRYLKIIYVPDENDDEIFIVTAYDLSIIERKAYRRRQRRRN